MSAPTPNPDGKSFWTPRMLTATVVVAVIVIAGIILFGESMALFRLASVALIIAGLVGLKMSA